MQTSSSSNTIRLAVATVLAFSASVSVAGAQVKATSGPTSTVVYVSGNDVVVKAADGKLLNYNVAPGTTFAAGGKSASLADLKPGTKLTKEVSTGFDPQIISSVTVVKGKVFAATPPDAVTLSLADGIKELMVPTGTTFMVGGKPLTIDLLKPDMMVDATIVTTIADNAKPEVANAAAPSAPTQTGALLVAKTLADGEASVPEAGTNLPLYGIMGFALLMIGGFLMLRKPAVRR
jgi:hypothetical protein